MNFSKDRRIQILSILSFFAVLFTIFPDTIAFAAGVFDGTETDQMLSTSTGITGFDDIFGKFAKAIVITAKPLVGIMTAIAGVMVVFGMQDASKTFWNLVLGVGLALNFGSFLMTSWGSHMAAGTGSPTFQQYSFVLASSNSSFDFLGGFMTNYLNNIIIPGAVAIQPICIKLLLIIALIDGTIQISLDLVSGDKIKFLIMTALKGGFFIFLISNWLGIGPDGLNLMNSLSKAFEEIGLKAGGAVEGTAPDSIIQNGVKMFTSVYKHVPGGILNIGTMLVDLIALGVSLACILLTALEIFMVRIEFYTMALITMPLLAFGMSKHLYFLTEKAIGAMANLAIKLCVVTFIASVAGPLLVSFAEKFNKADGVASDIAALIQMVVASLVVYFLTKKVPALVQGLLSGTPSLGGGDMKQMAMNAASKAGGTAGAVRAASNMDGGGNSLGKPGMVMSALAGVKSGGLGGAASGALSGAMNSLSGMAGTAKNLGKIAYRQNPMSQGFQKAASNYRAQSNAFDENRAGKNGGTGFTGEANGNYMPSPVTMAGAGVKTAASAARHPQQTARNISSQIKKFNHSFEKNDKKD